MSAPTPFQTDPFHQLSSVLYHTKINFYIYTKLFHIFLSCCISNVSWNIVHLYFTHALFRNSLFYRFSAILKSFCMNAGTNWYEIQRDTVFKTRHRCIQYGVCKNKTQLAKKSNFYQRVFKISNFGQSAKGGPFAKFWKSAILLLNFGRVENSKYQSDFGLIDLDGRAIYFSL